MYTDSFSADQCWLEKSFGASKSLICCQTVRIESGGKNNNVFYANFTA
jgi:hypothetical protein